MQRAIEIEHGGKITWGDLKKIIESSGVVDKDEIDRIDISWGDISEIEIKYDDDFGWQVYL